MSRNPLQLLAIACLMCQFFALLPATVNSFNTSTNTPSGAYCDVNETYVVQTPVTKTRQVETKPTGFFKVFKKSKTQVEQYVDMLEETHVRIVSGCCPGYRMTEMKICEPICEYGCPQYAFCKEPNLCQCRRGYAALRLNVSDGGSSANASHHCVPLCEPNCPSDSRCIAPGVCECERGYHQPRVLPPPSQQQQQCLPRCASGCAMPAGNCVAPDVCECAAGYELQADGGCAPICNDECTNGYCSAPSECACEVGYARDDNTGVCVPVESCGLEGVNCLEEAPTTTEALDAQNSASEDMEPNWNAISGSGDDDTVLRRFASKKDSEFGSGDDGSGDFSGSGSSDADLFPSSLADCALQPCIDNVACKETDRCACAEGFVWHQPAPVDDVEIAPICAALIADKPADRTNDQIAIVVTFVGMALLLGALLVLAWNTWRHRIFTPTTGDENDLCCKYDKRNSNTAII